MNHLSESLHQAVADPPPPSFDVDGLIGRERRRRRRLAAGAGSALAVVAVIGAVTVASSGVPDGIGAGGPSGGPEPALCAIVEPSRANLGGPTWKPATGGTTPTEERTTAIRRLSAVLNSALPIEVPGATFTDMVHPVCDGVQFEVGQLPIGYGAGFLVSDQAGSGAVVLVLSETTDEVRDNFALIYPQHETRPDGTLLGWVDQAPFGGGVETQVGALRPDGTYVVARTTNTRSDADGVPSRSTPPLTVEQLVALCTNPGLTLYP